MANKRPNKQQRQRQNRQQRQARQARSVRAGEATAIARGERQAVEPTASTRAGAKTATAKAAPAKGGRGRYTIPGQRAVVMAFLFTIVSAATLLLAPVQVQREVDIDDPVLEEVDEEDQEVDEEAGTVSYVDDAKLLDEEDPAVAAGVMLTPILITGAAVWFTKRPQRSNVWTMAMIGLAAYIFLFAGPYGIITLPSMIALAVGGFQSRRAESKERLAELRTKKAVAADGEVIDVEATEESTADPATDDEATDVVADDDVSDDPAQTVAEDDRR